VSSVCIGHVLNQTTNNFCRVLRLKMSYILLCCSLHWLVAAKPWMLLRNKRVTVSCVTCFYNCWEWCRVTLHNYCGELWSWNTTEQRWVTTEITLCLFEKNFPVQEVTWNLELTSGYVETCPFYWVSRGLLYRSGACYLGMTWWHDVSSSLDLWRKTGCNHREAEQFNFQSFEKFHCDYHRTERLVFGCII
jgi:hypothetical protein